MSLSSPLLIMDVKERVWPQYLLAFVCNLGTLCFGFHLGWLSPLQPSLQSEDNPLIPSIGPLNIGQISWLGSLPGVTLLVGPFIFGVSLQKIGRKSTLLLATIPNIVALLLLLFATNIPMLYIGRAVAGLAACIFTVVPIYVNECVEDSIRGLLGGLSGIFLNLGIVFAYVFGGFTSYQVLNITAMGFSLVFLVFYNWLPESPQYLVTKNKKEEAVMAVMKLRGGSRDKCEETVDRMFLIAECSRSHSRPNPRQILTSRTFLHGIFLIMSIFLIQQLSGISAITAYSVVIFAEAGTSISPVYASIIMSLLQVLGSILGTIMVDRLGRRFLLLLSSLVVSLSLSSLTLFLFLNPKDSGLGLVPVFCLSLYMISYASGFGTIAYILLPELFPSHARPYASSICGTWISLVALMMLKCFPIVNASIKLAGSCTIFTSVSIFGFLFIYFFVFETKNKTTEEILERLGGGTQNSNKT